MWCEQQVLFLNYNKWYMKGKKKQLYNKNNIYLHTNWFFHLLAFVQLIWLWIGKYDLSSQQKIENHVKISCFVPNVQNHCICPIYHISKITLNGVTILIQWIFVNINCEYLKSDLTENEIFWWKSKILSRNSERACMMTATLPTRI